MQCSPVHLLSQDESKDELEPYLSAGPQHLTSSFCHHPRDGIQTLSRFLDSKPYPQASVKAHVLGREIPDSAPVAVWAATIISSHGASWGKGKILLCELCSILQEWHLRMGPIKVWGVAMSDLHVYEAQHKLWNAAFLMHMKPSRNKEGSWLKWGWTADSRLSADVPCSAHCVLVPALKAAGKHHADPYNEESRAVSGQLFPLQ